MAKRRKTATRTVVVAPAPRAAAPIIKVSAPRAAPIKRRKHHSRKRGGISRGGDSKEFIGVGIGGAAVGFVEKTWGANIPTVPILGRMGTVALGCWIARKQGFGGNLVRDMGIAASAIAGYQLGLTGKISGEDDVVGALAEQI